MIVVAIVLLTRLATPMHVESVDPSTMLTFADGLKDPVPNGGNNSLPEDTVACVVVAPRRVHIENPVCSGAPSFDVGRRRRMGWLHFLPLKGERWCSCDSGQHSECAWAAEQIINMLATL